MKTKSRTPLLISVLALALMLMACDRLSATTGISAPATVAAQDVSGQPTLNVPDIPAQQTPDTTGADTPEPNPPTTLEPTALPAQQPTPTPAPIITAVPAQPTREPDVSAQATADTTTAQPCTSPYTVQLGDRLFSIGRTCNVNPYAIAQVNNIYPPYYTIYPGQQLTIPGGTVGPQPTAQSGDTDRVYFVKPGDNLFRIALSYGVSLQALAAANGLSNYNLIYIGQKLNIP
jgi:LysM repeat protein